MSHVAEQDSRRTPHYLFLCSHCDRVRIFPCITQSTNELTTVQRYRLELTVWFVPSIIENAVAVGRSFGFPRNAAITYILYLLSLGIDDWPRPWSNVPTPRLAHDPDPTPLAPHWLCQSSDGDRNGWLCRTSICHGFASIKIWDWVFAAIVSTIDGCMVFFGLTVVSILFPF